MGTELFIYYRVREADVAAATAAVRAMQTQLRAEHPHLNARVLRRPETDKGSQTWMETYASDTGLGDTLPARIATLALALQPLIDGERHTEAFVACAS